MSAQPIHSVPSLPEASDYEMVQGTRDALALISSKWSVEVLYLLASGTRRYSEILYDVGEISKKTLTQTLRALERRGLVKRLAYAEVPPRVEYSLSPLGWSITSLLMTLYEWSATHLPTAAPPAVVELKSV
ncbi:MAG: transcriptional regulator, HxlR family [Conexibacter sp.]|jgi:DNA-binding HxlR family transcriptional regulator|nr:transcriptional regulator, HxlR family [Conexibacter sp.]MCZ4491214.1 transcriptional regulator, HxlR family [Conexibacter sp.]